MFSKTTNYLCDETDDCVYGEDEWPKATEGAIEGSEMFSSRLIWEEFASTD